MRIGIFVLFIIPILTLTLTLILDTLHSYVNTYDAGTVARRNTGGAKVYTLSGIQISCEISTSAEKPNEKVANYWNLSLP